MPYIHWVMHAKPPAPKPRHASNWASVRLRMFEHCCQKIIRLAAAPPAEPAVPVGGAATGGFTGGTVVVGGTVVDVVVVDVGVVGAGGRWRRGRASAALVGNQTPREVITAP